MPVMSIWTHIFSRRTLTLVPSSTFLGRDIGISFATAVTTCIVTLAHVVTLLRLRVEVYCQDPDALSNFHQSVALICGRIEAATFA